MNFSIQTGEEVPWSCFWENQLWKFLKDYGNAHFRRRSWSKTYKMGTIFGKARRSFYRKDSILDVLPKIQSFVYLVNIFVVLRAHVFRILEQLLQKWVHVQIQGQIMFKYNNKTKELNYKNMAQSQKKGRLQSRHLSLHLVKYLNTRVCRFFFIVDFEYIF